MIVNKQTGKSRGYPVNLPPQQTDPTTKLATTESQIISVVASLMRW